MSDEEMNGGGAELTPVMIEGELRILDIGLGRYLGFARPTNIRKLIERHQEILSKISVLHTVEQTSGAQGGRPTLAYYLNRKQAIYVTTKADTANATDVTIHVIERFDAYERGAVRPLSTTDHPAL